MFILAEVFPMKFNEVKRRTRGLIVALLIFSFIGVFCDDYYYEGIAAIVFTLAGLIATDLVYLLDKVSNFFKFLFCVSIVILFVYALTSFIGIAQGPFLIGYWVTIIYSGWCRMK